MAEYIELGAAINLIRTEGVYGEGNSDEERENDVISMLESLPAADVEPVTHGRWLPQILLGERVWDCSECKTLGSPHWKRCPVCEAKMEVDNG